MIKLLNNLYISIIQEGKGESEGGLYYYWLVTEICKEMFFVAIINNNQIINWKKYLNVKTSKIDDTYNNLQEYKPASDEELKKK